MPYATIELLIKRPPTEQIQKLKIAQEQYKYNGVDVFEGEVDSIETLAATLLQSTIWRFWWD
jgi:hypothetical protein